MPGRVITTATLPSAQTKEFSSRIRPLQLAAGTMRPMRMRWLSNERRARLTLHAILRETVERNATKFDCNSYRSQRTNEHSSHSRSRELPACESTSEPGLRTALIAVENRASGRNGLRDTVAELH
jgi:hypothetical protein